MGDINFFLLFGILGVGLIAVAFFGNYLKKALNISWYILIQLALGALFIFLFNIFGQLINIYLPINIVTAGVVGILGIPGLVTLIVFKLLLPV